MAREEGRGAGNRRWMVNNKKKEQKRKKEEKRESTQVSFRVRFR